MSNDVNSSEQALLARLRALPRERVPRTDLWPSIQARLGHGERRLWWSQAVAAALVAGLGLAILRLGGQGSVASAPGGFDSTAWQVSAAGAELEYSGALRDMRGLDFSEVARLAEGTGADVVASLELVDEASRQVRAAIEKNPEAAYLTSMLATLHRKRLSVLRDLALSSLERDAALRNLERRTS